MEKAKAMPSQITTRPRSHDRSSINSRLANNGHDVVTGGGNSFMPQAQHSRPHPSKIHDEGGYGQQRRRDQSSSPNRSVSGQPRRQHSNPPGKRTTTAGANATENGEQEIKSLRFELAQVNEILSLRIETVENLREQLDQQRSRLTQKAQKTQSDLQTEVETLRKELELLKSTETKKEANIAEL